MGHSLKPTPSTRQLQRQFKLFAILTLGAVLIGSLMFVFQTTRPEKVYADVCESSYSLNWADSTTWDVDCGDINAGNWSVKGMTCNYYSPVYTASGVPGDPNRILDIDVRINQSGNLN